MKERPIPHTSPGVVDDDRKPDWPKCCLCGATVTRSGWCDSCDQWPVNVVPHRYDESGHVVAPDGFCPVCMTYVATRLVPEGGRWRETGEVPTLLSREENKRRMHALVQQIELAQLAKLSTPRDLQSEKARILADERERHAEAEQVPF